MINVILFAILASEPSSLEALKDAAKDRPEVAAYLLCASKRARELERSSEAAETIAAAAVAACDAMIDFPVGLLAADYDEVLRKKGEGPLNKTERAQFVAGAKTKLREVARTLAVTSVVGMRAQRNAANR